MKSFKIWVRNYLCLKNYVTSEGAVPHNVLYVQLSIASYEVLMLTFIFPLGNK